MNYELSEAKEYEKYVFENIITEKLFSELKLQRIKCAVCDSSAVRAYTPFKRPTETDIDFIFPDNTNMQKVAGIIDRHIQGDKKKKSYDKGTMFIRVYFSVPIEQNFGNEFILDFHIGGYHHKNKLLCKADGKFFDNIRWQEIGSLGGMEHALLPIPKINEIIIFKLIKFLGNDPIDIISFMLSADFSVKDLANRIKESRRTVIIVIPNLSELFSNLDKEFLRWNKYYFRTLTRKESSTIIQSIDTLITLLDVTE